MSDYLIYVADDDINVCHLLKSHLENEGYAIEVFHNGQTLLDAYNIKRADMIITDIMMPIMNGYELCKAIRQNSDVPIIMLSAKDEEIDRVLGLELGSDDYIAKPFSLRELTIKVRNMLRRWYKKEEQSEEILSCKDVTIHINNRAVYIHDNELKTTAKEFELLFLLIKNKNRAFSREEIIQKIWGYDYIGDSRQVDHLIKRLRKKMLLEEAECKIETIWGFGYKVSE